MSAESIPAREAAYDVIVIGGGFSGIIFLKYAREQDLNCLVLEKQDDVGGLWKRLPAWQDIQNRKEDFAINEIPLDGVKQPDVHRHAHEWVQEYDLSPYIRLQCEVTAVSWHEDRWRVQTNQGPFHAAYLVVASGVQNQPFIPTVERSRSAIVERHSSALQEPQILAGQRVTVVGGGTSSWDLLDLAIENGAQAIHWVYRSTKYFLPTSNTKQGAWPNLRELAILQSITRSSKPVSAFNRWLLNLLYDHFEVTEIKPEEPFDIREHQLIPGRATMIHNFDAISRHESEIRCLEDREILLENGERLETDVLLWGTGYRMNLGYLGLPEYSEVETLDDLFPKLGSLVRSKQYPNLFFLGMTLLDSTSATPFFVAIESKTIVAHILGHCEIPQENVQYPINHWDLFSFFAQFDRANYQGLWSKIKYFLLAWWYLIFQNKSVKV